MVRSVLSWAQNILKSPQATRKEATQIALDGISKFNKGKISEEGKNLVKYLKSDCELIGFIPHVAYIKENSRIKSELNAVWVHPFAQRTLLYKIKDMPCLLIVNSSISKDDSALRAIEGNHTIDELLNIAGITG